MVYVHVPFCRGKCIYCAFYSLTPPTALRRCGLDGEGELFEAYTERICTEMKARRGEILSSVASDGNYNTLYIGGGTPSVLPLSFFRGVASTLSSIIPTPTEFTVEVNPDDVVSRGKEFTEGLLQCGVNRISMGIQSLDDGILRWMHRRHDSRTALEAVNVLRECGVGNLSLDLIFGIPGMGMDTWRDTLERTLALRPEHLSAYQLSFDEGSPLGKLLEAGKILPLGEEECKAQYDLLCSAARSHGYIHYEVSNFCLPSMQSRHNSAYWRRVPYVGLGSMAHSFSRTPEGVETRQANSPSLLGREVREETLSCEDARLEELMLHLRTNEGISRERLYQLCEKTTIESLMEEGSLLSKGRDGRIVIPEEKFFISDSIICELA